MREDMGDVDGFSRTGIAILGKLRLMQNIRPLLNYGAAPGKSARSSLSTHSFRYRRIDSPRYCPASAIERPKNAHPEPIELQHHVPLPNLQAALKHPTLTRLSFDPERANLRRRIIDHVAEAIGWHKTEACGVQHVHSGSPIFISIVIGMCRHTFRHQISSSVE
jgi:hypothetical protein